MIRPTSDQRIREGIQTLVDEEQCLVWTPTARRAGQRRWWKAASSSTRAVHVEGH
jgi:hypothetical protein